MWLSRRTRRRRALGAPVVHDEEIRRHGEDGGAHNGTDSTTCSGLRGGWGRGQRTQGGSTRGRIPPTLGSSLTPSLLPPRRGAWREREGGHRHMSEREKVRHDLDTEGSREGSERRKTDPEPNMPAALRIRDRLSNMANLFG
jgi:hypothetical protein